jgi:hypothetical protein
MVSIFKVNTDGAIFRYGADVAVVKFPVVQLAESRWVYTHVKKGLMIPLTMS